MSQVLRYINEGKRHFTHFKRRKAFEMTAYAVCGGRSPTFAQAFRTSAPNVSPAFRRSAAPKEKAAQGARRF